jgi:hypothetical protein
MEKPELINEIMIWIAVLIMVSILIIFIAYAGWIGVICIVVGGITKWIIDEPLTNKFK